MKFKILHSIIMLGLLSLAAEVRAQFPYVQSFKDEAAAPTLVFGGSPNSALLTSGNIDAANSGYLRLTNSEGSQTGFVYNNSILPTTFGMDVEFEYFIYGGSGADGLTFFLFDASTQQFRVGQFGGALGYAHNCNGPGISNAYLGVGFDAFGNFSGSGECKSGQATGAGSIIVRGPGNGQQSTDYPQIAGVNTNALPVSPFLLTEGRTRDTLPSMSGYRKAFITIRPQGVGFSIIIKVQHGTVITNVLSTSIATPPPTNFKFGFTASTGGSTNYHEIRNLKITIPTNVILVKPRAVNDILPQVCSNDSISYNILANDTSKNAGGTLILSSIDLDTIAPGIQDTLIVPSVGNFYGLTTGSLKFVPVSTFAGTHTISYRVTDSYGQISNGANITVSGRLAPFLTPNLSKTITSGQAVDLELSTTPATTGVTYTYATPSATGGVTGAVARATASALKISDILISPLRSPQTVTYRVVPTANGCIGNTSSVVVTVTNGNTAPVVTNDVLNVVKNNSGTLNILANDRDANSDVLTTTVLAPTKNGTSTLSASGNFEYTPNKDFSGVDTLRYQTCDSPAPTLCSPGIVVINVRVNQAPTVVADTFYTTLNKKSTGNVKMNDSDANGDAFGPGAVANAATEKGGTITMNVTGNFTYLPAPGFLGTDRYTYEICDIYKACTTATLIVIVLPNLPPIALKDSINTIMNKPVVFSPLANDSDPERDLISIALLSNAATEKGGKISSTQTGNFTYTPAAGFIGLDKFEYTVCDTMKNCTKGIIVMNVVEPVNEAPIAKADSVFTTKNIAVSINPILNDIDPEGAAIKASQVTNVPTTRGGTVTSDNNGIFTYTPPLDFVGRDSYTYQVCDLTNKCSNGVITFIVLPTPNVKPIAIVDRDSTLEETSITIFPLRNDKDSDGELVNNTLKTKNPKHGTVTTDLQNGSITYTPFADFVGLDTIPYTICDNGTPSLCADAFVIIKVLAKPLIPLFIPEGFSPNGDLVNQQYVIEGIEKLKVSLVIFNRWGDKVYESKDYKNDWEGNSNTGVTLGQGLPDGTYFISVDFNNGTDPIAKYITISR